MKDKILAFIGKFQNEGTIKTFTEGCCYYYAAILSLRFDGATLMYNPVENHFATRINGALYDITGEIPYTDSWVNWHTYPAEDWKDAERVVRDCIIMED